MASVADLFRLNDGSTYQNTLAQVLQVINQAEQRGVQREGIDAQRAGQAMDYDAKMQGIQSSNMQAVMQDQRQKEIEGNKLKQQYAELDERRANNQMQRAQDQQKLGIDQQNADTQRGQTMGDLFYKGKEDTRKQGEYNMKEYDWQEQKANQQTLSKALQEGGVEAYTETLGKLGMTKEFGDALQFLETRKRNTYLNQESYLNSVKTGTELEVGARMREAYKIAAQYSTIAAKDSGLADEFLPQALANSKYHRDMGNLPIETVKVMFPSSAIADGMSLGKNSSDPTFLRSMNKLYKGFTGAESPFGDGSQPTDAMQNAQAIMDAKASGNTELANYLQQGSKKSPLVQIGPDGEEISPSEKSMVTEDQKQLAQGEQVQRSLEDLGGLLKDPTKSKYLLKQEKLATMASKLVAGVTPADIMNNSENGKKALAQIEGSQELQTKLARGAFEEILRIAATTFTAGIVDKIKQYYPSEDDDPITASKKVDTILGIINKENEVRRTRLAKGGTDVSNNKDKQAYLNSLSPEQLDQLEADMLAKEKQSKMDSLYEKSKGINRDDLDALVKSKGWESY